jgi:multicomponent Na+:H+ antiporter subunit C
MSLAYLVAAWLLLVGVYGIVTSRHLVHLIVCLVVVQSSTYVLLLGIGYRTGATPPIFASNPPTTTAVDPVVQAMTLTDVVVEATATAMLLAFALQAHKRFGSMDPRDLRSMRE